MSESAPAALMERLAGHFAEIPSGASSEVAEEVVETVADAEQETEEVVDDGLADYEWNGSKVRVPKELLEGAMRNEDYTRKAQEVAEQRKSLEQVQATADLQRREQDFLKSVEGERQELYLVDSYLKQFATLNWSTMSTEQIMRTRIEMDQAKDRRAAIVESIGGKQRKFMEELQTKITDLRGKAKELASKSIQGFSEETEKSVREYAKAEGLADREIDNVLLDPRSFKILYKASQFDKIKAGAAKAGETADKVLRPGTAGRKMPTEVASKLNFGKAMNKATSSADKAKLIEQRLAGSFSKGHK